MNTPQPTLLEFKPRITPTDVANVITATTGYLNANVEWSEDDLEKIHTEVVGLLGCLRFQMQQDITQPPEQ